MTPASVRESRVRPALSIVMPCYNEEASVGYVIPKLVTAFDRAGIALELIAVDNGSRDRTGERLRELSVAHPGVVPFRVDVNQGYGNGVLQGFTQCTAPWVGIIPADGQVDAADVVELFEAAAAAGPTVVAKVRRRYRMDGLLRKMVSVGYNLFFRLLWPAVESLDINGSPKILPREAVTAMLLHSKEWFLDPEIMIKSQYLGLRVLEFNVFARMRGNGLSHVRATTCWEFFSTMLRYRFSGELSSWRKSVRAPAAISPAPAGGSQ